MSGKIEMFPPPGGEKPELSIQERLKNLEKIVQDQDRKIFELSETIQWKLGNHSKKQSHAKLPPGGLYDLSSAPGFRDKKP